MKKLLIISILLLVGGYGFGQDVKDFTGKWQSGIYYNDLSKGDTLKHNNDIESFNLKFKKSGKIYWLSWLFGIESGKSSFKWIKIGQWKISDSKEIILQLEQKTIKLKPLKDKLHHVEYIVEEVINGFGQEKSISHDWKMLSDSVRGCTTGGQHCYNGKCGGEGCCFDLNRKWKTFFKYDKKELSLFLIKQLPDTSETRTHICPFFNATKGELATYCLQRIYKVNWYDLDKKWSKIKNEELTEADDFYSEQNELQKELKSKEGLDLLTKKWKEKLK